MGVEVPEQTSRLADADYVLRDQDLMRAATRYFQWQANLADQHIGNRVVEVGCGIGNFTEALLPRHSVVGVDIAEACIRRHRARFSQRPGVESAVLDVADPAFLLLARSNPDSVVCMNVLEHVKDDVQALQNMRGILRPGSAIVLLVPAFPSLYSPIDERLHHFRRYTKENIQLAAHRSGLRVRDLRYMNLIGFFGWWMNGRFFRKTQHSQLQIDLFDSLLVPIQSRLEQWRAPLFGQSLFAVLERV